MGTTKVREYAVVVAGGKGTRLGGSIAKQFVEVAGKPVLLHTLEAFIRYSTDISIILVLPEGDFERWSTIINQYKFAYPIAICAGGHTRFHSVRNGLASITGDGLVAIHDGVRPLVSKEIIATSFRLAEAGLCAVASVGLKDTIRMGDTNKSVAADRTRYRLIQTPQTFPVSVIREAYRLHDGEGITDDAGVAEKAGHSITLFEGSYENLKITTQDDLTLAEALFQKKSHKY